MYKEGLVSVCCLGYNHGKFINYCIDSILKNKYKNIEIIIVDDGSTDNSKEILQNLKLPVPLKLILQENTGNIGYNINQAIKKAEGEFIITISLDDMLYSDAIDRCVDIMSKDKNIAFIASSIVSSIDENNNLLHLKELEESKLCSIENITFNDLLELEYSNFGSFYVQGSFFRKEIIDAVGGFDEDIIGDDIVLRTKIFKYLIQNNNYTFKIFKEPLCYYRRHDHNISKNSSRQIKIVTQYLDKYWPDRPYPEIMVSWFLHTIKNLSLKETFELFSLSKRLSILIENPKVKQIVFKKFKHKSFFEKYIFYKEKDGNKRKIKIFGIIKIKYTKNRKKY